MSTLILHKVIAGLPSEPRDQNAFYAVRVGSGFDLYLTDSEGLGVFKINGSPAGAASISNASLEVTPARMFEAMAVFADEAVTPTSKIVCSLAPNEDWDGDDLLDIEVTATPGEGNITFCISRFGPIVGQFSINYQVG